MNPRNLGNFFKSKFGLFVVFIVLLFSGLYLYGRYQASEQELAKLAPQKGKKIEIGAVKLALNQGLESGVPQQVKPKPDISSESAPVAPGLVEFRPVSAPPPASVAITSPAPARSIPTPKVDPKPPKVRHASLLQSYSEITTPSEHLEPARPSVPERFVPFGTLLKCKLVNTIDSANLETPLIAILLEDVWQNGRKVIPANTLVHGTARSGRMRDRIIATGAWRFVWQDGRELPFNGVALDREYEHDIDGYGITDGSGGIKGRVIATDDLQELKLLASAALTGFARGTQERQQNALGSTLTGSVSNGVREGVGEVFDLYAKRTLKDIEDNGYFVRVAAGKEFYVYVLGAVDPQQASIAGVKTPAADIATDHTAVHGPRPNSP